MCVCVCVHINESLILSITVEQIKWTVKVAGKKVIDKKKSELMNNAAHFL